MFGLRLCLLVVVYIVYVCLRHNPSLSILLETILLFFFTVIHVAIMPYKNVLINYLDTFFLVDSVLLNLMALYGHKLEVVSNLLIAPVFLVFCGIVVYHVYLVIGGRGRFEKILPVRMMKKKKVETALSDGDEGSSEHSSLNLKTSQATYSTLAINDPPNVQQYNPGELREPLLETDSEEES